MGASIIDKKPSFYARLSSLIFLQVVFVFIAVVIVVFFPRSHGPVESGFEVTKRQVLTLGQQVSQLGQSSESLTPGVVNNSLAGRINDLLATHNGVATAGILRLGEDDRLENVFYYDREEGQDYAGDWQSAGLVDYSVAAHVVKQPAGFTLSTNHGTPQSVFYTSLGDFSGQPAVLISISEPGLVVSERSNLWYAILLLFLVSTLLSLLTVYLIHVRVRIPMQRLMRGLEKTAAGELFYLIEADTDNEINSLVSAFNRMTRKLWDNQQKLNAYTTRLKKINLNLIESQLFLATLIDSSPFPVVATTIDGQIMLFNRTATEAFGYANSDVVGEPIAGLFAAALKDRPDAAVDTPTTDDFDARCRRADGSSFPAYVVHAPVVGRDGNVTAYLYIIRDISESASFQEMMIRIDRYCTRGEMAGDIAHEINNYLAILAGNLDLMPIILRKGDSEKIDKKLQIMSDTVDKIARFADGLMDVPQDQLYFEKADLNQLVENILAFLKPQNRFDEIQFKTSLSADLPLVEFDPGQIQQLLVNLIFNAADAVGAEGIDKTVTVETSVVEIAGTRSARVEVADRGPGVPEDRREDLFEKRFTTKRKGHGIGLITCRRIVDAHAGNIGYEFVDGAKFYFTLPLEHKPVESSEATPAEKLNATV